MTASERAIDDYLDALLQEPEAESPQEGAGMTDQYRVFDMGGLMVAVPAGRVAELSALPALAAPTNDPNWLRATLPASGEKAIVDVAQLVLPSDLAPGHVPLEERCGELLTLDDGGWGIAIEGEIQEQTLDSDTICWRGPQGKRLWLAGTIADKRCVLLDLDNIRRLGGLDVTGQA